MSASLDSSFDIFDSIYYEKLGEAQLLLVLEVFIRSSHVLPYPFRILCALIHCPYP